MEPADTTHFSIVDAAGNAVSNTYTINWPSAVAVVEGAGFLLNNEMDDFSAKPGTPNIFGVIGNIANEIQPGKRMLSSMTPTLLLDDAGKVTLVIGTPGEHHLHFGIPGDGEPPRLWHVARRCGPQRASTTSFTPT